MKLLVMGDFQGIFPEKLKKKLKKEDFDAIIGVGDYGGIDDWRPWLKADFDNSKKGLARITPKEFFGKKGFKHLLKKDRNAAKNVLKELNNLGKPVILIFGNGDDDFYNHPEFKFQIAKKSMVNYYNSLKNIKEINYGKIKFRDWQFFGFGGYMDIEAYFNTRDLKNITKEEVKIRVRKHKKMKERLFNLLKKGYKIDKNNNNKIFIFHYPPIGVFDIIKGGWKGNPMKGKSSGVRFYTESIRKYQPKLVFCGHMHEYQGMKKIGKTIVINPGDSGVGKYAVVDINENGKIKIKFSR